MECKHKELHSKTDRTRQKKKEFFHESGNSGLHATVTYCINLPIGY
jgi:hypothetical protein